MKGNFTSNYGHILTPWPYLLQEKHNMVAQSLRPVAGWGCGACVGVPGSRHFNIASISVGAEGGGSACAGTAGSRHFSIASRSANPTKGPVMAATTCSVGPSVGSLTAYTGRSAVRSPCCGLDKSALGTTLGAENRWDCSSPTVPGSIDIYIGTDPGTKPGLRGLRVTTSKSMVSVSRSSPAAFKSFGSSDCSRLIFKFLTNPDHVQPSQLSHRCPDKITLGHGHQIVAVREPATTTRL